MDPKKSITIIYSTVEFRTQEELGISKTNFCHSKSKRKWIGQRRNTRVRNAQKIGVRYCYCNGFIQILLMSTIFCRFSLIFMEGGSTKYLANLLLDFNGDLLALVNDGCSSLCVVGTTPFWILHYLQIPPLPPTSPALDDSMWKCQNLFRVELPSLKG